MEKGFSRSPKKASYIAASEPLQRAPRLVGLREWRGARQLHGLLQGDPGTLGVLKRQLVHALVGVDDRRAGFVLGGGLEQVARFLRLAHAVRGPAERVAELRDGRGAEALGQLVGALLVLGVRAVRE